MAKKPEEQLHSIVPRKNQATELDSLIQGYRLYARTEGKSPRTVGITNAAMGTLRN
jgi:hypothetical protein